jgi:hypothetical protein
LGNQTLKLIANNAMRLTNIVTAPDETVFGIAGRLHRLSGNRSSSDSLLELFGSDRILPGNLLPGHLGRLFEYLRMDDVGSYPSVVDQHTVLPYWRLFVPVDRYRAVQSSMWWSTATGLKLTLGLISSRLGGANVLRYCDACAQSDLAALGVPTWHRKHQLPRVLVCPEHALALNECDHLPQHVHRHTLFLPDQQIVPFKRTTRNMTKTAEALLLRLAVLSAELLDLSTEKADMALDLRAHYLAWLDQYDLITFRKRTRVEELQRHVLGYWAPICGIAPFANLFESIHGDHCWLVNLVRKHRGAQHPLKHLLLIGSIAPSIEAFLYEIELARTPPAKQRRITILDDPSVVSQVVQLMTREQKSARLTARELGVDVQTILTIARRHGIEVARRSKCIFFGQREKVRHLLSTGCAFADITREIGISISTISRVLAEDPSLQRTRSEVRLSWRRNKARQCLLGVLKQRPMPYPTELRKRMPASYMWLYRNDRAWLYAQLKGLSRWPRVENRRADWAARDVDLAKAIRSAAHAIRASKQAPVRITLSELGRRTGRPSWLEKHRAKLPICTIVLQGALETVPEFQARRLEWWDRYLTEKEGLTPAPSRLRRLAGISNRCSRSSVAAAA